MAMIESRAIKAGIKGKEHLKWIQDAEAAYGRELREERKREEQEKIEEEEKDYRMRKREELEEFEKLKREAEMRRLKVEEEKREIELRKVQEEAEASRKRLEAEERRRTEEEEYLRQERELKLQQMHGAAVRAVAGGNGDNHTPLHQMDIASPALTEKETRMAMIESRAIKVGIKGKELLKWIQDAEAAYGRELREERKREEQEKIEEEEKDYRMRKREELEEFEKLKREAEMRRLKVEEEKREIELRKIQEEAEASRKRLEAEERRRTEEEEYLRQERELKLQQMRGSTAGTVPRENGDNHTPLHPYIAVPLESWRPEDGLNSLTEHLEKVELTLRQYGIPESSFISRIANTMKGAAVPMWTQISASYAPDYQRIKNEFLKYYSVSESSYRQQFRSMKIMEGETWLRFTQRCRIALTKWHQAGKYSNNEEGWIEMLIKAKVYDSLSFDTKNFVIQSGVERLMDVIMFADRHMAAGKETPEMRHQQKDKIKSRDSHPNKAMETKPGNNTGKSKSRPSKVDAFDETCVDKAFEYAKELSISAKNDLFFTVQVPEYIHFYQVNYADGNCNGLVPDLNSVFGNVKYLSSKLIHYTVINPTKLIAIYVGSDSRVYAELCEETKGCISTPIDFVYVSDIVTKMYFLTLKPNFFLIVGVSDMKKVEITSLIVSTGGKLLAKKLGGCAFNTPEELYSIIQDIAKDGLKNSTAGDATSLKRILSGDDLFNCTVFTNLYMTSSEEKMNAALPTSITSIGVTGTVDKLDFTMGTLVDSATSLFPENVASEAASNDIPVADPDEVPTTRSGRRKNSRKTSARTSATCSNVPTSNVFAPTKALPVTESNLGVNNWHSRGVFYKNNSNHFDSMRNGSQTSNYTLGNASSDQGISLSLLLGFALGVGFFIALVLWGITHCKFFTRRRRALDAEIEELLQMLITMHTEAYNPHSTEDVQNLVEDVQNMVHTNTENDNEKIAVGDGSDQMSSSQLHSNSFINNSSDPYGLDNDLCTVRYFRHRKDDASGCAVF